MRIREYTMTIERTQKQRVTFVVDIDTLPGDRLTEVALTYCDPNGWSEASHERTEVDSVDYKAHREPEWVQEQQRAERWVESHPAGTGVLLDSLPDGAIAATAVIDALSPLNASPTWLRQVRALEANGENRTPQQEERLQWLYAHPDRLPPKQGPQEPQQGE